MMQRAMTITVVAGLLGTLGIAPAMAAEATLYGSVRTGIYMINPDGDGDTTWDLGSVDAGDLGSGDKLYSRLGIEASHELDGGVTASLKVEKRLDNFRTRLQKVTLSGDFGTLDVGQMYTTYYNATTVDGANFFGGKSNISGSRSNGVKYSSNLGGPFNFSAMVQDDNSGDDGQGNGLDVTELSSALDLGVTNLSVGWRYVDDGDEDIGVRAQGSFGPLGYKIGGGTKERADGTDVERFGVFVSYAVVDGGTAYGEYEDITDDEGAMDNSNDYLVLGYAHTVAPGFKVIGEFRTPDTGDDVGAVVLRVDF